MTVSAALIAGCGGGDKKADKGASGNVVKVGVFLPLTGDNAAGGELELRGIKLANKLHPEVNGKRLNSSWRTTSPTRLKRPTWRPA